jgi:hypothetical protein
MPKKIDGETQEGAVLYYGGAVKALGDGKIGGYLVRYGDPEDTDLVGDFFDAKTDFGPHKASIVYYHHGLDNTLKRRVLDKKAQLRQDDVGIWIEAQLALRDAYEKFIHDQVVAGKMGWSSSTAEHLVERERAGKANHITSWPLGLDASVTPVPAEPRNSVIPLKSLSGLNPSIPILGDEPEATGDVAGSDSEETEGNKYPYIQLRARAKLALD